jgi:hypothetical protein
MMATKPIKKPLKVTLRGLAKINSISELWTVEKSTQQHLQGNTLGFQKMDISDINNYSADSTNLPHYTTNCSTAEIIKTLESIPSGDWARLTLAQFSEGELNSVVYSSLWAGLSVAIEGEYLIVTAPDNVGGEV